MRAETGAELERRIVSRLLPLDSEVGAEAELSDYDLNPGATRDGRALVDAAVLVALAPRPDGSGLILTRRTDTLTRHAGQIAFPGGRCDPGETVVETALREAQEEVGLAPAFVRPLALAPRYVTGSGYRIAPVVAMLRGGFTLEPSPAEVAEVFETPWAWLMDPANVTLDSRTFGGAARRFHSYAWRGRTIWGATAGMLQGLRTRLYGEERPV